MFTQFARGAAAVLALVVVARSASATITTFEVNTAFSGATSAGVAPFITLQFDDEVVPGAVRMTASAPGLNASEWVARINLNLDPGMSATDLFFDNFVINSGTMLQPVIFRGSDSFEAGGGGNFDVQFEFAVSGGGFTRRFNLGESFSFDIIGGPGLTASSFGYLSAPPAPVGVQQMSALIQGIGPNADEGFHTVPEPSTGFLALLGGLLLRRTTRRPGGSGAQERRHQAHG